MQNKAFPQYVWLGYGEGKNIIDFEREGISCPQEQFADILDGVLLIKPVLFKEPWSGIVQVRNEIIQHHKNCIAYN